MGSEMCIRDRLKTDAGLQMVQQALDFFQQANYSRDVSRALTQIARAKRRQGDYNGAIEALNQKLQIAQQGGGQPQVADANTEIGAVLIEQEKYPQALQRYDEARAIYQSVNSRLKLAFAETNRANILWRLGRTDEAKKLLDEGVATAGQSQGDFKQLIPIFRLTLARIALSERNFPDAATKSTEALTLAGSNFRDTAIESTFTLALARTLSGGDKKALEQCESAVKMATETGDRALLSQAILAHAEVALHNGDAQLALTLATQAQERFEQSTQLESLWRTLLIAAQASEKLRDNAKRDQYLEQARNTLLRLQQEWGDTVFKLYTARPDIQYYQKQLG